jgi:hypothetical protein
MKTEIYVPTKLAEIPLQNYQKFMKVINNSNDQEFIAEKTIEIFCGLNLKEVIKIKWSDVKNLALHFNKLFQEKPKFQSTFKIQNMEFGFIPNMDDITFGEYIDLESNITSVDNFHKAMAVMYRPIKTRIKDKYEITQYTGTDEFSELMKFAPLDVVMAASVFFWNLGNDLVNNSLSYLETEITKNPKLMITANERSLESSGVGIIQSMQLLREMLPNLMKLQGLDFESVLPFLLMNDKKTKLNNAN